MKTLLFLPTTLAFTPIYSNVRTSTSLNLIGIFYGTSTGSTEEAAHLIAAEFGDDAAGPFEIDSVQGKLSEEFGKYDALVVSFIYLVFDVSIGGLLF
jgi:hypothetical protein